MNPIVMLVAGGTGSGKSTLTSRLYKALGEKAVIISYDNYYKDRSSLLPIERENINYDSPDAFDTTLIYRHIKMLKKNNLIQVPIYDFTTHCRIDDTVCVRPKPIIIVEGILALYDQRLRGIADIKVFVEADADERILRRIQRDMARRGRNLDHIIAQYRTTVKPMHELYVQPTKRYADIVVQDGLNPVAIEMICSILDGYATNS